MKQNIVLILLFSITYSSIAQINEFGIFAGGSNFIGDIGATTYIAPNEAAMGILYKWNKSPRHAWRISYIQSNITGQDINSDNPLRVERRYAFTNTVKEGSVGLEFNFFDFNLHEDGFKMTPYIYTGVSVFSYSEIFWVGGKFKEDYKHYNFALPMVVGIKTRVSKKFILGLETGIRYTFTDNLDGSNPRNEKLSTLKFGNLNSKDWFIFTGFTLTYTFSRKPCYCNY